jgi:signal transduction histidine kinase
MEADAATISVVDERAGEIILKAHRGLSVEYIDTVGRLKLAPEEIEVVMAWQGPIVAEDEALNRPNLIELWAATQKEGVQSSFAVPLLTKRFFLGAVVVAYRYHREFTSDDVDLLSSIANQIAVGIHNAQLLEEAQAKIEELKAAQEYLVQTERQRALAEMAGGVAHDFNNVLSVVLGRAQLALEDVKEPKLKEGLQIIERSAYDAANMVRQLQEFTGATVGEKLEALDLNQVVKSALKMVETRRAENQVNGVKIDIDADLDGVYTVEGNPVELRRVLLNIIFNAMDALPQGGRIAVKTAREDSCVLLSISDTGTGMTEEVKKRIFDPFFTTKGSRGSGLGLSASHGIISRHKGIIEVDSTIEKGSTFYIRLPIFNGNRRKGWED